MQRETDAQSFHISGNLVLKHGYQTRGPRVACGLRQRFVWPAIHFGHFQIINIMLFSLFTGV